MPFQYDGSETLNRIGIKDTKANIRDIECRFFPIKNSKGKLQQVILMLDDVSEKKQAEEALKKEQQKLFSLLDGLPAFVYLQAPDYSIRFANEKFKSCFWAKSIYLCS